jgi:hypothetical protein
MKSNPFLKLGIWILCASLALAAFLFIMKDTAFFKKNNFGIQQIIRYFPFSKENSLKEWEEKILKGKVTYMIEQGENLSYVRARSLKTASALYYKVDLDIDKSPLISWNWRVDAFPKRNLPETIEGKKEEDFAARVYAIFPAAFFTRSKVIEYIWSETLPAGTTGTSGYSKNIKVLVLREGASPEWRSEKRDLYADYVELFGEEPRLDVGAIAFMTDADSTKTSAEAVYDEIQIGYK